MRSEKYKTYTNSLIIGGLSGTGLAIGITAVVSTGGILAIGSAYATTGLGITAATVIGGVTFLLGTAGSLFIANKIHKKNEDKIDNIAKKIIHTFTFKNLKNKNVKSVPFYCGLVTSALFTGACLSEGINNLLKDDHLTTKASITQEFKHAHDGSRVKKEGTNTVFILSQNSTVTPKPTLSS